MDPLSVLRDFNTSERLHLVQHVDGNVSFGDRYNFPASTPVYKQLGRAGAAAYSLHDVLFYLKSRQLKPQEYVMAASQAGVGIVNIMDRKKVLEVLDGAAVLDPSLVPVGVAPVAPPRPGAAATAAEEPQAKRQRVAEGAADDEVPSTRGLVEQERQLRNRNTMLVAANKDFRKVLEVVANTKKLAHKQAATAAAAAHKPSSASASAKQAPPPPSRNGGGSQPPSQAGGGGASSSSRYGRDSTADQLKAMGASGGALAINMYGTSGKAADAAAPPPPPPSAAAGYVPVRKGSSAAAAPGPAPAAGSSAAGSGSGSRGAKAAPGSKPAPPPPSSSSRGGAAAGGKAESKKAGVPIIIVPSGMTSMLNMHNAKSFLEEGLFVPSAQALAAAGGAPKPAALSFRRTAHRAAAGGVEYSITDRAPPKDSPDWERVAAVVVQGAKWQFKDWPHKGAKDGDLAEALSKVCGFFLHYADEKVVPPVLDWNVRTVALHRENRHKDMTAMLEMYRHLDTFLTSKRSPLAF